MAEDSPGFPDLGTGAGLPGSGRAPVPVPPSTWLAPAVLATLCCFPVTGVVALYHASQVSSRWSLGDRRGALAHARKARAWVLASFLLWVAATIVVVVTGKLSGLLGAVF